MVSARKINIQSRKRKVLEMDASDDHSRDVVKGPTKEHLPCHVVDVDRILAEAEIKSLVVRERYYRDSGQWDKLRNSYHPDASKTSINISWYDPVAMSPFGLTLLALSVSIVHSKRIMLTSRKV